MIVETASRAFTDAELRGMGMCRCMDCLNHCLTEGGSRACRLAWRPSLVPDKWRRCKPYQPRDKNEQSQCTTEHQAQPGTWEVETRRAAHARAVGIEAAKEILRGQERQDRSTNQPGRAG